MKIKNSDNGMTLIEVIVATAVLGIVVVLFAGAFNNGFGNILAMGSRTKAVEDAQTIIDYMYNEETTDSGIIMGAFPEIKNIVPYANLETSPYDPAKPIYYSVSSKDINIDAINTVTVEEVTVLVFYDKGSRHITLTALMH